MIAAVQTELLQWAADRLGGPGFSLVDAVAYAFDAFASDQDINRAPEAVTRDTLAAWGAPLSVAAWNELQPLFIAERAATADRWAAEANEGDGHDDWRDLPAIGKSAALICFSDTGPDGMGRRRFSLYWGADGFLRGQCFHADPANYTTAPLEIVAGETEHQAACRALGVVERGRDGKVAA